MATIPADDTPTYDRICRGDTVGVFQIESRAQMAMLPRLKPRVYYDLVIEVSIVRPGPITGGMVHPYLRRRNGEEPVEYPHPSLEPVLKKTLGVPLFQEQVIRLAVVAADYTPGEADQLRRDMAAWRRTGRIERHRERLTRRMEAKGIAPEFAERVFEQIRGFGEYGFPESHAASFALIAYATAWMRQHYPEVFACSLLNAQPMGFYSAATIVEDAKRHGVDVRGIDALASEWDCTLEPLAARPPRHRTTPGTEGLVDAKPRFAMRMGARYVKGLSEGSWQQLRDARRRRPFRSIEDVVERTRLDEGSLLRLAESGAFDEFVRNRREALWRVRGRVRLPATGLPVELDERPVALRELDTFETISWDYDASRHSARAHPLEPLRDAMREQRLPDARTIRDTPDGRRVRYAGLVICRQRPGTASGVVFLTLEDETGFVNVVVWSQVFQDHDLLVKTSTFLGVTGRLQSESGVTHIIADTFWTPKLKLQPRTGGSRDFH